MRSITTFNQTEHGFKTFIHPDPAPGAGFQWFVPDHYMVSIISLYFTFACSAAAANRYINAVYQFDGNTSFQLWDHTAQTAAQTLHYLLASGIPYQHPVAAFSINQIPTPPDCFGRPGDSLLIVPENLQAADQLSEIYVYCKTWILI